jgi:deoxyribodipyrimidine photo-lyase
MRALLWLRDDLRLDDHAALAAAAAGADELLPVFVLDDALLASPRTAAARVSFLLACLDALRRELEARGSRLVVRRGDPADALARLLHETRADRLHFGRTETPYARRRDARVHAAAARAGAIVREHKDRVVFESGEIRSTSGRPYAVYTHYRNAWHARRREHPEPPVPTPHRLPPPIGGVASDPLPDTAALGATLPAGAALPPGGEAAARSRLAHFLAHGLRDYARLRDVPALDATSRLSPYLRFGAISARTCIAQAEEQMREDPRALCGGRKWIDELVWREFYASVLAESPRVLRESYRPEYDTLEWNDDPEAFAAWCEGSTGYPIVDAAMRQLAHTGWMHNRLRMIVASFLTKDLLLDWRLGEAHFQRTLVDGDPASNNGGWQWAASTGTDAQPYFRIFNPVSQGEKIDPDGAFVRRFLPELEGVPHAFVHRPWDAPRPPRAYPAPIVSHAERRVLALQRYEAARRRAGGSSPTPGASRTARHPGSISRA